MRREWQYRLRIQSIPENSQKLCWQWKWGVFVCFLILGGRGWAETSNFGNYRFPGWMSIQESFCLFSTRKRPKFKNWLFSDQRTCMGKFLRVIYGRAVWSSSINCRDYKNLFYHCQLNILNKHLTTLVLLTCPGEMQINPKTKAKKSTIRGAEEAGALTDTRERETRHQLWDPVATFLVNMR